MVRFDWDPQHSKRALLAMGKAPAQGPAAVGGIDWAQGAMGSLVQSELLAAQAGLVPWVVLPNGERGVVNVGAARERVDHAPSDVRTIYLATHGAVRRIHATARPASPSVAPLSLGAFARDPEMGNPLVIALVVVAVAASIATAWYVARRATIEVEGRNLRTTALASNVSEMARMQLEKTGRIDPGLWSVLKAMADSEAQKPPLLSPWLWGSLAVAGVGGTLAWRHWKKERAT